MRVVFVSRCQGSDHGVVAQMGNKPTMERTFEPRLPCRRDISPERRSRTRPSSSHMAPAAPHLIHGLGDPEEMLRKIWWLCLRSRGSCAVSSTPISSMFLAEQRPPRRLPIGLLPGGRR